MTTTAPTLFARSDFHATDAKLRDNVAIVADEQDAAIIQLEAEVGAAARRLRESNRPGAAVVTTGPRNGARARIDTAPAVAAPSYFDVRQAASDADRMQRHQQLAARGAALRAQLEASRPAATPEPDPAPRSLFSR